MYNPTQEDFQAFSDMHKDAYGFRPRGLAISGQWTNRDEFMNDLYELQRVIDREEAAREEAEIEAELRFDAMLEKFQAMGAGTRKDAFRWLMQAEGETQERDFGFLCYKLGLPYSMEAELKGLAS